MEIDEAKARGREKIFLQQLTVGHHYPEIGLKRNEVRRISGFQFFRLKERQAFGSGPGGHGIRPNLLTTPGRSVRLRIHGHYLGVGQGTGRGESRERDLIRTE